MNTQLMKKSALKQILLALLPYSRQNLMLSFSPNRFFNELEQQTGYNRRSLKQAYDRGQDRGLISPGSSQLTTKGYKEIQPFIATRLKNQAKIMVVFDIPEQNAIGRRRLRAVLKSWQFNQVQKSVWATDMDYREALVGIIAELKLSGYVEIYECARLFPSSS